LIFSVFTFNKLKFLHFYLNI